jgi:xanthine dehydrogenase accessory factor
MTELERIESAWKECESRGETGVLATVVRVEGSTYRRAGARLLLTSGDTRVGSVSGGCLEADLIKKAWWLTEGGRFSLRRYDTSSEGEIVQEFGLGCNGVIHVLLERLGEDPISPLAAVAQVRELRQPAVLATVISTGDGEHRLGRRWLRMADGTVTTDLADAGLISFANQSAETFLPENRGWEGARRITWGAVELFVEPLLPALRLLVFGAGDDAIPMVKLAKFMGYEVIVLDGRAHFAKPERFPSADHVLVNSSDEPLAGVAIDDWTAAVVMSHSYQQDLSTIIALSSHPLRYLGVLGPRKRTEELLWEAGLEPAAFGSILHSPIGLDIGADGAEQIALSAIAEIQAVLNSRAGGTLREKAGEMHARQAEDHGQPSFASSVCPLN